MYTMHFTIDAFNHGMQCWSVVKRVGIIVTYVAFKNQLAKSLINSTFPFVNGYQLFANWYLKAPWVAIIPTLFTTQQHCIPWWKASIVKRSIWRHGKANQSNERIFPRLFPFSTLARPPCFDPRSDILGLLTRPVRPSCAENARTRPFWLTQLALCSLPLASKHLL